MSEIERDAIEKAIKGFEHEIRSLKNSAAREYNRPKQERKIERETLAISLLRAELEREKNQLTCDGCMHDGMQDMPYVVCSYCQRKVKLPDRYEPKGEKA